mmetsp:Transcript_10865/g.24954  ORF Transcript_10865/g.24954 Transcript_10865/m.24954 type:complete len:397 (-) Transcript_10865:2069-3259(-)
MRAISCFLGFSNPSKNCRMRSTPLKVAKICCCFSRSWLSTSSSCRSLYFIRETSHILTSLLAMSIAAISSTVSGSTSLRPSSTSAIRCITRNATLPSGFSRSFPTRTCRRVVTLRPVQVRSTGTSTLSGWDSESSYLRTSVTISFMSWVLMCSRSSATCPASCRNCTHALASKVFWCSSCSSPNVSRPWFFSITVATAETAMLAWSVRMWEPAPLADWSLARALSCWMTFSSSDSSLVTSFEFRRRSIRYSTSSLLSSIIGILLTQVMTALFKRSLGTWSSLNNSFSRPAAFIVLDTSWQLWSFLASAVKYSTKLTMPSNALCTSSFVSAVKRGACKASMRLVAPSPLFSAMCFSASMHRPRYLRLPPSRYSIMDFILSRSSMTLSMTRFLSVVFS